MTSPSLVAASLRTRVFAILIVPLLGLVWLSWDHFHDAVGDYQATQDTQDWMSLTRRADAISHELMLEADLAGRYLQAPSTASEHALHRQQRETDRRVRAYDEALETLRRHGRTADGRASLEMVANGLAELAQMRDRVLDKDVTVSEVGAWYRRVVRALIGLSRELLWVSQIDEIDALAMVMTDLMEINLDAVYEQRLLAEVLRKGHFDAAQRLEFQHLGQAEDARIAHIQEIGDPPLRETLADAIDAESMHEVAELRAGMWRADRRAELGQRLSALLGYGDADAVRVLLAELAVDANAAEQAALTTIAAALDAPPAKARGGSRTSIAPAALVEPLRQLATPHFGLDPRMWEQVSQERIDHLLRVEDRVSSNLFARVAEIEAARADHAWIIGLLNAVLVMLAVVMAWTVGRATLRQLGADPHELSRGVREIASGNLDAEFGAAEATGVLADLRVMQQNLRDNVGTITRSRQALEAVTSAIMLADIDYNVIFTNDALRRMFAEAEDDIRRIFPSFDARDLQDMSMDRFHADPAAIRQRLNQLTGPYRGKIVIGARHFQIIATPVVDAEGVRIGTVVEWKDRTQEVEVENELKTVVEASRHGVLDERIELEGKEGFFRVLSEGINSMLATNQAIIGETQRVFSGLARGDLTQTIDAEYEGAYGSLKRDANTTVATFIDVIGRIQDATSTVRGAAAEIAQGNANLSARTENQAASLEETAASMEQMTGTVKKNADSARESSQLAAEAREQADHGGRVVGQAVGAMREISTSSRRIAEIIGVIDEIAFQTNLLSLNAAVEAARAGEQGRGFAVVAGEVGKLAQRSATAAKEIKDLIEDSKRKVEEGERLVNDSGAMLDAIVDSVSQVSTLIAEIAHSSNEQSTGIDQVNTAVAQMDVGTQQNAALVEEIAAASHSMEEQVRALGGLIDFFRTQAAAPVSPAAPLKTAAMLRPASVVGGARKLVETVKGATGTWDDDDEWEEF